VNVVTAFEDVLTPANHGAVLEQVISFYQSFLDLHDTQTRGPGEVARSRDA
jgi:hypothetical protein